MTNRILIIIQKTFTYGLFSAISAAVPFFLLPILTRYLLPEDYGILALLNILIMFIAPLLRLEVQASLRREYIEKKNNFSQYISTAIFIPFVAFAILLFLALISAPFFKTLFGIPKFWIFAVLFISLGTSLFTYLIALYQIQDKAISVGIWKVVMAVLVFVPTVILVVFLGFDWQGRAWPMLVSAVFVQMPISLYLIYKMFPYKLTFHWDKAKEMLEFSLPLIPMTLATYILQTVDRLFITKMVSLEAVGLYAVAAQLAAVMMLAYNSFLPTWEVWVFRNLKEKTLSGYKKTVQLFYLFCIAMLVLALFSIFIFPHIVPWFLGKPFQASTQYLFWLVFAVMMRGGYYSLPTFISYTKKTRVMMYVVIFMAILNCALNYVFIKMNGAVGAAQATFIVYLVGFIIFLYIVQRKFKLPWLKCF